MKKINEIKGLIAEICMNMGENTACDYDGVETENDAILYLKSIKRDLPIKSIGERYIVEKK